MPGALSKLFDIDDRALSIATRGTAGASRSGQALAGFQRGQIAEEEAFARERQASEEAFARERQASEEDRMTELMTSMKKQFLANGLEKLAIMPSHERPRGELALSRLMADLGIDPSVHQSVFATIPQFDDLQAAERQKLLDAKRINTSTPESIATAQSGGGLGALIAQPTPPPAPVNLVPQAKAFDPRTGKLIAENTSVRAPSRAKRVPGFKERVLIQTEKEFDELEKKLTGDEKLSSLFELARGSVELKQAQGKIGVAEAGRLRKELSEAGQAVVRFDNAASDVFRILDETPAAATISADLARGLTAMTANMDGLAALIKDVEPDLAIDEGSWEAQLVGLGVNNSELRSAMFNIALQEAMASGLASGRLSNQQIELALQQVAAGSRSPQTIKAKLKEVSQRLRGNLKSKINFSLGRFGALDNSAIPAEGAQFRPLEEMTTEEKQAEFERLQRDLGN